MPITEMPMVNHTSNTIGNQLSGNRHIDDTNRKHFTSNSLVC